MNDGSSFDVFFAGECLEGHAEAEVRAALGKLFKADAATLERLFSGRRQLVKRDCDHATALKYQRAMKAAGAKPIIAPRREASDTAAPEAAGTSSATREPQSAAAPGALSLAPSGTEVLRPEERRVVAAPQIDTSHLSDSPVGERLEPEHEVTPQIAAPDYEVADAGTTLGEHAQSEVADNAHAAATDALSLAEGEFDLSDCAPEPEAPPPIDLDHLELAAEGSELLEDAERRHDKATAPDTSHLSISTEDTEH